MQNNSIDPSIKKKGIRQAKKVIAEPQLSRFNDLKKDVFNPNGEHLGKVEDIILDIRNKRIAFGILSFGGIFGLGDTQYAIPWDMMTYEEKGEKFILDVDKEKLTEVEPYDPKRNAYYGPWANGLYMYWGYPPYWVL